MKINKRLPYITLEASYPNPYYRLGINEATLALQIWYKKSFEEILSSKVTEAIARDVLNNSKYLMTKYQPFNSPLSESNGESDNEGTNYDLDTKLLFVEDACKMLVLNNGFSIYNNTEFEFFFNIAEAYKKRINHIKPLTVYEKNQIKILNKLEKSFFRYKKNLMFFCPFPQLDYLFSGNKGFERSYISSFCQFLSFLKARTNFKHDLYLCYCLYNNEYNLIKINDNSYISEAFIPSTIQKENIVVTAIGQKTNTGLFFPYQVYYPVGKPIIQECLYTLNEKQLLEKIEV